MARHYTYRTSLVIGIGCSTTDHEPEMAVRYTVTPGHEATRDEPGCGPMVELETATVKVGNDWIAVPEWLFGLLYSDEDLHAELLSSAADADEYARDQAADARREDLRMGDR